VLLPPVVATAAAGERVTLVTLGIGVRVEATDPDELSALAKTTRVTYPPCPPAPVTRPHKQSR
jgi:hypothetical protein